MLRVICLLIALCIFSPTLLHAKQMSFKSPAGNFTVNVPKNFVSKAVKGGFMVANPNGASLTITFFKHNNKSSCDLLKAILTKIKVDDLEFDEDNDDESCSAVFKMKKINFDIEVYKEDEDFAVMDLRTGSDDKVLDKIFDSLQFE